MTKLPSTFPKSRIHSDSGRIKISRIFIGVMIGIGSAKLCANRFGPFSMTPLASMRIILISDSATVTFMSFVGGLKPIIPIRFEIAI